MNTLAFPKTEGNLFSTDHQQFGWDLQFLVLKIQDEGNNSSSALFNGVNNNTAKKNLLFIFFKSEPYIHDT